MIAMNKVKEKNADWAGDIVGAVARIAYAGSIHGFEKIVAARIWLATHIQREAKLTEGENASQWRSAARNNELTCALDDWENEGGRC